MFEIMGQAGVFPTIVPKWHLDGQLARTDFFNVRVRRGAQKKFPFSQDGIWVDLACLEMEENVCLEL